MLIARWQIDARFGHKQTVIDMLRAWTKDIAPQIGWTADKGRMLTGSIGAREATVVHEWAVPDLADLEKSWGALGKIDAHKKWSKDMEQGHGARTWSKDMEQGHGALCRVGLRAMGNLSRDVRPTRVKRFLPDLSVGHRRTY